MQPGQPLSYGQYSDLKKRTSKTAIRRGDTNKGILPLDCREQAWQAVLDAPEDRFSEVNETHVTISRPTVLVVVVRPGVGAQISANLNSVEDLPFR